MIVGLLVMDLLWAAGLIGLTTLSALAALHVHAAMPGALGLALALAAFALTWIAITTLALLLIPKPAPGQYRMMRGAAFYYWSLAFIARRWLDLPPLGTLYRQSSVLRFLVLRAAGAKIAFGAQMSSDATLLDPGLLTMGEGAMLGSQSTVAGHFIVGDRLVLAPVVIEAGAQVALGVVIGPGAFIGARALVEGRANIAPEAHIGAGAVVGATAMVGRGARIGAGAKVAMGAIVPAFTTVPDGARFPAVDPVRAQAE